MPIALGLDPERDQRSDFTPPAWITKRYAVRLVIPVSYDRLGELARAPGWRLDAFSVWHGTDGGRAFVFAETDCVEEAVRLAATESVAGMQPMFRGVRRTGNDHE